jgi:transposase-like protein
MARRTIAADVKAAVVAAALVEGADLPAIATQYGVSLPTVYNWKNAATRTETVETPAETTVA